MKRQRLSQTQRHTTTYSWDEWLEDSEDAELTTAQEDSGTETDSHVQPTETAHPHAHTDDTLQTKFVEAAGHLAQHQETCLCLRRLR